MSLYIQDPDDETSTYLIEVLLESCQDANKGGGAFAFASAKGVQLLIEHNDFVKFGSKHPFELVVGVDAITNTATLKAIKDVSKKVPKLRAKAFLSDKGNTLFHPKLSWFHNTKGGKLIAGSGNLTGGGLRRNREAFTVTELNAAEAKITEKTWNHFINFNDKRLYELDDPKIVQRAEINARIGKVVREKAKDAPATAIEFGEEDQEIRQPQLEDKVLIAEIPGNNNNRWSQANFSLSIIKDYFQTQPDTHQRIFLYNITREGSLALPEVRPIITVKSRNFRFELKAGKGQQYPSQGRPIGVFVRIATRTFLYCILFPDEASYVPIYNLLVKKTPNNIQNKMRRVVIGASELKRVWPNSWLWNPKFSN